MTGPHLKRLLWPQTYRGLWPILTAIALLLVSLAVPRLMLPASTWHYVVTFDISQSMNVRDVSLNDEPTSRLALARARMARMLQRLPCGSTIGWSIFTEHRSFALLMPLEVCANYDVLLAALEQIDDRIRWRNSSQVGKGLFWAIRNSQSDPDSNIVFVSDGHEAPPKRPGAQLMPALDGEPVHGWVIGVGSDQLSQIPKTDATGRVRGYWRADEVVQATGTASGIPEHLSSLRENHLRDLARFAGLNYQRLTDENSLAQAMMDKSLATRQPALTDVRWIPALIALMLLCWSLRGGITRRNR